MKPKKPKMNGGVLIPKDKIPPSRTYSDKYAKIWDTVAELATDKSYAVKPADYGSTINALRCSSQRAKRLGRIPADVLISYEGKSRTAYIYRG